MRYIILFNRITISIERWFISIFWSIIFHLPLKFSHPSAVQGHWPSALNFELWHQGQSQHVLWPAQRLLKQISSRSSAVRTQIVELTSWTNLIKLVSTVSVWTCRVAWSSTRLLNRESKAGIPGLGLKNIHESTIISNSRGGWA